MALVRRTPTILIIFEKLARVCFLEIALEIYYPILIQIKRNQTKVNRTELKPAQPNQAQPSPTKPNPTKLNSTQLNSTQLNSTQLNPTQPNPTQPNPTLLYSTISNPSQFKFNFTLFYICFILFELILFKLNFNLNII